MVTLEPQRAHYLIKRSNQPLRFEKKNPFHHSHHYCRKGSLFFHLKQPFLGSVHKYSNTPRTRPQISRRSRIRCGLSVATSYRPEWVRATSYATARVVWVGCRRSRICILGTSDRTEPTRQRIIKVLAGHPNFDQDRPYACGPSLIWVVFRKQTFTRCACSGSHTHVCSNISIVCISYKYIITVYRRGTRCLDDQTTSPGAPCVLFPG